MKFETAVDYMSEIRKSLAEMPPEVGQKLSKLLNLHDPTTYSGVDTRVCPSCADDTWSPHRPLERVPIPCDTTKEIAVLVSVLRGGVSPNEI